MTGKKKAAALAVLLALVLLLSAVFIVLEAGHDCHGEHCAICVMLRHCEQLLGQAALLLVGLMAALSAPAAARLALRGESADRARPTLVSWRVKLSD